MITEPGIYTIPAAEYLADPCPEPSLSASIVKRLCLASPLHAWYDHPRLNPAPTPNHSDRFDLGTAAHALLIEGTSAAIDAIDAKDWRTKAAQEQRDASYAAGRVPLLARHWADVQAMVACARAQLAAHADGGATMFTDGLPEQTLVWREEDVWCRARLDWLRPGAIDDYKTAECANPEDWTRAMFRWGADIQVAWYLRGVAAVKGRDVIFRFAVQETEPPYALSVIGLGPDALMLAEKKVRYGLEVWREARARGEWIGYPRRTCWASLPMIHEAWWLEREQR